MEIAEQVRAEAARLGGTVVWWWSPLDSYEPVRKQASGHAVRHATHGRPGVVFWPHEGIKDPDRVLYLVDDGSSVVPHYVAAWKDDPQDLRLFLDPMPTNPDRATRPDNGLVIDYSTWALGPHRAYHVKIVDVAA